MTTKHNVLKNIAFGLCKKRLHQNWRAELMLVIAGCIVTHYIQRFVSFLTRVDFYVSFYVLNFTICWLYQTLCLFLGVN